MNIELIIKQLRDSDRYIETIFTEGACYQFHLFLNRLWPDSEPYINESKDHVVTMINDFFYDINGIVDDEENYTLMDKCDITMAEDWSFSRTKMLQLGECAQCEEPILI